MPWMGVTVMEQRIRFLEDYQKRFYSVSELAERFSISRKTAYKWIDRYRSVGEEGFSELSRRPRRSPQQTAKEIADALRVLGRNIRTGARGSCWPSFGVAIGTGTCLRWPQWLASWRETT